MLLLATFFSISSIKGGKISLSGHARVISVNTIHTLLSSLRISESFLELIGFFRDFSVSARMLLIGDFKIVEAIVTFETSGIEKINSSLPYGILYSCFNEHYYSKLF